MRQIFGEQLQNKNKIGKIVFLGQKMITMQYVLLD